MADRLLLISSLLLVVLTVIFAQFMDAEKFWQGHAVDIEVKMIEKGLTDNEMKLLAEKHSEFDRVHNKHKMYGRIFAGLMSFLLFVTVFCLPIDVWKRSTLFLKYVAVIFTFALMSLGIAGLLFAFGTWRP